MRGDLYLLAAPKDAQGHEQDGQRYAVVVQSDLLPPTWSTVLIAPTSTRATPGRFRPRITMGETATTIMVDQVGAVDARRLGDHAGRLSPDEMVDVDAALRIVLGLLS